MIEEWKVVPDFYDYMVSNFGEVKSKDRIYIGKSRSGKEFINHLSGRILKKNLGKYYYKVGLYKNNKQHYFTIHRLVLIAFVGFPSDGQICCHNDGNPLNNRLDNLRWDTYQANFYDSVVHGGWRSNTGKSEFNHRWR